MDTPKDEIRTDPARAEADWREKINRSKANGQPEWQHLIVDTAVAEALIDSHATLRAEVERLRGVLEKAREMLDMWAACARNTAETYGGVLTPTRAPDVRAEVYAALAPAEEDPDA